MTQEIKINLNGSCVNGGYNETINANGLVFNQLNPGATSGIIALTTSDTALGVGSVSTNGYLFLKNLDSTNFFKWGPNNSGSILAIGKCLPGEIAFFRLLPGVTFRLQADTATVNVQYLLLQA